MRSISFTQAVNESLTQAMAKDDSVICYGLGVTDPKAIFGTTAGLVERFGSERVFDMPTAENGMLGIGIGAALSGLRPVMVHQRLDFFLLAMDQLVNTAAKWHFMFAEQQSVPITIRLIVGRGWGQGPTHAQSLQSWFAHIPGLKVVMPARTADVKGLLLASVADDNPVIFIEHRWLHHQQGFVAEGDALPIAIDKSRVVVEGDAVTIIALSYQVAEAMRAAALIKQQTGLACEVIDMISVNPIDWGTLLGSVRKTGRLLCVDTGAEICSVMSEVVARASMECFSLLYSPPARIAMPFEPEGTSYGLTRGYYPGACEIAEKLAQMLNLTLDVSSLAPKGHHDVPGEWFKGPF